MGRILYAWEVGDHSGHVVPFLPLLRRLRDQGHDVVVAARDTAEVGDRVHAADLALAQAPVCLKAFAGVPDDAVHYTEILQHYGYAHEATLTGLALGWKALFDTVRPDVVLANNSPLATWMARARGIRRIRLGSGFNCPPLGHPMPALRPNAGDTYIRREQADILVVRTLNAAGRRAGVGPIERFAQAFEGCETWLHTWPELDHYGARAGERYLGLPEGNLDPRLRGDDKARADDSQVFAYLRLDHPHTERMLATLAKIDRPATVYCPGIDEARERRFSTKNVRITRSPADTASILPRARVVVGHGGHNLAAESLAAGVPVLALPNHLEQDLVALNVERTGAGIRIPRDERNPKLFAALDRLLDGHEHLDRAMRLASSWRAQRHTVSLERTLA